MKKLSIAVMIPGAVLLAVLTRAQEAGPPDSGPRGPSRFEAVDVYLDPHGESLAAYQFEFADERGLAGIVGIEGGEHPAFRVPPYYDPAALKNDRVILAAFDTGKDLPAERTRIATLHVEVRGEGDPEYAARLTVAASRDGKEIPVEITLSKGE